MSPLAGRILSRDETEARAMPTGNHLPSPGRALVPLTPELRKTHPHRATPRPAAFLAHLIATARQVPQTRERRRVEPGEAIAAYAAAMAKFTVQ
jgi:hypothetical protein